MDLTEAGCSAVFLLGLALFFQGGSGIPLLLRKGSDRAQRLSALLMVAGSLCGTAAALLTLMHPCRETYLLSWGLPFGPAEIGLDPLSALFLVPVFLVTGCSAVYGVGYWPARKHRGNVARLTLFMGLLSCSMVTLLVARNGALFLMAWEVMALAAYFALTTEDEKPEVREAGTLYLITAHLGALALFALFALLQHATGTLVFPAQGTLPAQGVGAAAIFVTALLGFGLKAGVMPLHVWLPSAHANAPSHISAILSGVVLKTGIYGMVRLFSFFYDLPLWWGVSVLLLGIVSGVVGVAFAIGQHDLKRLLAYHSIENIGIIMMGLGIALIGESEGSVPLMVLGMGGALLHVVNHATFKSLLFLAAGAVIHATGTREIELLGGVGRRLPATAFLFLLGAVAICGLPPLNGFVSELMIYLGAFSAVRFDDLAGLLTALSAPALALVGGLAVACFVKVYGVVFLGTERSAEHRAQHRSPSTMLIPPAVLAFCCALIGIYPGSIAFALNGAITGFRYALAPQRIEHLVPLGWVSLLALCLLLTAASVALFLCRRALKLPQQKGPTWGCGYLCPSGRMQYSASSFADALVGWFAAALRPEVHRKNPQGCFPGSSHYASHLPETALERAYLPFLEYLHLKSAPLRRLQHGKLNIYIFYTFLTLVVLLTLTMR